MLIVPVSVWEELVDMVILVSDLELDEETQNLLTCLLIFRSLLLGVLYKILPTSAALDGVCGIQNADVCWQCIVN